MTKVAQMQLTQHNFCCLQVYFVLMTNRPQLKARRSSCQLLANEWEKWFGNFVSLTLVRKLCCQQRCPCIQPLGLKFREWCVLFVLQPLSPRSSQSCPSTCGSPYFPLLRCWMEAQNPVGAPVWPLQFPIPSLECMMHSDHTDELMSQSQHFQLDDAESVQGVDALKLSIVLLW